MGSIIRQTADYIRLGNDSKAREGRKNQIVVAREAKKRGIPAKTVLAVRDFLEAGEGGSPEAARTAEDALFKVGKRDKFVHRDADLQAATAAFEKDAEVHGKKAEIIATKRQKHADRLDVLKTKAGNAAGLRKTWLSHRAKRLEAKAAAYTADSENPLDHHLMSKILFEKDASRLTQFKAFRSGEHTPAGATERELLISRLDRAEKRVGRAQASVLQHKQWGVTQAAHKVNKAVLAPVGRHLSLSGHYAVLHGAQVGRAVKLAGIVLGGAALLGATVAVAPIAYPMNQALDHRKNINRAINPFTASKKTVHQRQALEYFENNPAAVAGQKVTRADVKAFHKDPAKFVAERQAAKELKEIEAKVAAEIENGALEKELESLGSAEG